VRQLANENPLVRAALLGVLLLAFVLLLYSRVLSQSEQSESPGAEPAATGSAAEAGSPAVTSPATSAAPEPAAPDAAPAAPPGAGAVPPDALASGKGLPEPVRKAYTAGKAVAVLIIKRRGIDDRRVRRAVAPIAQRGDAAVFIVRAKHIARYSRITLGVNVSRVPALVVVSPRDADEAPHASVSYGFRGTGSAIQAVRDALYKGGKVPYFPE
jgi:hypothetical protein